jgi:hypothetical protein
MHKEGRDSARVCVHGWRCGTAVRLDGLRQRRESWWCLARRIEDLGVIPYHTAHGESRPQRRAHGEGIQVGQVGSDSVDRVRVTGLAHKGIKVFDFS